MDLEFKTNDIITGIVTGITEYGIFVSLKNGYSGLIHISEISDGFVKNINNYAKINEKILCKVIEENNQTKQVKLSIKNLDQEIIKRKLENPNFTILQKALPHWIKEKMYEIKK